MHFRKGQHTPKGHPRRGPQSLSCTQVRMEMEETDDDVEEPGAELKDEALLTEDPWEEAPQTARHWAMGIPSGSAYHVCRHEPPSQTKGRQLGICWQPPSYPIQLHCGPTSHATGSRKTSLRLQ